jgi:hypothetical protein
MLNRYNFTPHLRVGAGLIFIITCFVSFINASSLAPSFSLNSGRYIGEGIGKKINFFGNGTAGPYQLADRFIIVGTDSVFIADTLISKDLFQIDYDKGTILFSNPIPESIKVVIRYQRIPFFDLSPSYFKYVESAETTLDNDMQPVNIKPSDTLFPSDYEALMINGSKTFGFSVGKDQGLGIEQATRLNLQGEIAGVQIDAALSDQSSPIPPEGVTKEISELDKILINVRRGGLAGSFGDYDLIMPFGSFGSIERKATGGLVTGDFDNTKFQASYSQPKGKFRRLNLTGIDGIQGPYQLLADEPFITIVPASEIVYLDGEPMTRGWNEDYTIDYTLAEIFFTNKRIINNNSRIEVFYEYTFDAYDRYSLGAGATLSALGGLPLSLGVKTFQESDNQNQSFAYNLSNADIESLALIGDDTSRTWLDGGKYVGPNQGDYRKVDYYYIYAGKDSGDYDVFFSFVGDSSGDYIYDDSIYVYLGASQGRYAAKRHILLPQKNEIYLTELGIQMDNGLNLSLEGSMSRADKNLFSRIDDANNTGYAYAVNTGFQKAKYGVSYKRKLTPSKFSNPMRSPEIDFSYNWGDIREEERLSSDELLGFIKPFDSFSVDAGTGWLSTIDHKTQRRFNLGTRLFWAGYQISKVKKILRQNLNFNPTLKFLFPKLYVFKEDREISRRLFLNPSLGVKPSDKLQTVFSYEQNQDDCLNQLPGQTSSLWRKESIRRTYKVDMNTKPFSFFEFNGILGLQVLEALLGTASGSWQQYFADLSGIYSLAKGIKVRFDHHRSNQQTQAKLEQYIRVDSGTGDYKKDPETGFFYPDTNGNYNRILTPTGAMSRSQEQEWHGNLDFSWFEPINLKSLFSLNQEKTDTSVLFHAYNQDIRLGITPFIKNREFLIYFDNNYTYSYDLRYTEQKSRQNQNNVEVQFTPIEDLSLKAQFDFNLSQRERTQPLILHREREYKINLEPFIGYKMDLEIFISQGWRNINYTNYNDFQLITSNLGFKRRWQFRKNTTFTTEFSITRRTANIDKLPFEINLNDPLGITPEINLVFDYLISKELVFSTNYRYLNRPDRAAEQYLSANFRAYF